jgi:hypothetical protein
MGPVSPRNAPSAPSPWHSVSINPSPSATCIAAASAHPRASGRHTRPNPTAPINNTAAGVPARTTMYTTGRQARHWLATSDRLQRD